MTKINKFRCRIKFEDRIVSDLKTDDYDDIIEHMSMLRRKFL